MPELRPRVDSDTCNRCRKKFRPGDRVVTIFIVQRIGHNPQGAASAFDHGAWLSNEFELAHERCEDPGMEGRLIGVSARPEQ
jgi:hypothetical protein